MKLYIPKLSELLILEKDWEFDVHLESRNASLFKVIEGREMTWEDEGVWNYRTSTYTTTQINKQYPKRFTIPKLSVLSVERIYIRKGATEFDSVTFRVKESSRADIIKARFWAKLDDVNMMEIV